MEAVICGGSSDDGDSSAACFALGRDARSWAPAANLTEARTYASMTSFPAENSSIPDGLLVAGGRSTR
jgi:hypothetical protein